MFVANGERVKLCELKDRLGYFMLELQKIYTIDPCRVAFSGDTWNNYLCTPARVLMTDQTSPAWSTNEFERLTYREWVGAW